MRRTLSLAMLISLAAASPAAQALGLADPQVQSSLNEPLQARIALTDLRGLDPTLLKARLADEAAFEQAGLSRSVLAESVRMALERGAGGLQLVLTTDRAVREPYLDLLVTLLWPGGQQRRQITLLFDPPGYASAPSLINGMEVGVPPRLAQINPAPLSVDETSIDTARPPVTPSGSSSGDTPLSQLRVQPGDTLWGLAARVRPDTDISIEQVMLALLQANPGAFPDGNINGLRAGVTLVVPSRQVMLASTPVEATGRVQAQNQAWRRDEEVERSVAMAEPENNVATEAQSSERQTAEAPSDVGPRLTLLSDADLAAERAASMSNTSPAESISERRLNQLAAQSQASREALASSREERERLQDEIATLRQDVAELREMLLAATPEPVESEPAMATVSEPVTARAAAAPAGPSPSALSSSNNLSGDAESRGFWQIVSDNLLTIAGVAIALLLALWVLVRRRNADDRGREGVSFPLGAGSVAGGGGSISPSLSSTQPASPASSQSAAMDAPTHDMPQASELTVDTSQADAPQASAPQANVPRASAPQAETISEADIFIAYGRFDRARELLRQSLDSDPERHDLRLKLLTVHVELGEREDARREAACLEALDEPDYRNEAQRLMSRLDGAVKQHDAPHEGLGMYEDNAAHDDIDDGVFNVPSQQSQTLADDVSHVLWDDETANEGHKQDEKADTTSEGYVEYEPPSLDSPPADHSAKKHDEGHAALQQPSIDYPGSVIDSDNEDDELDASIDTREEMPRRAASIEQDWEVEEVAFEPLNLDNETSNPGSKESLDKSTNGTGRPQ